LRAQDDHSPPAFPTTPDAAADWAASRTLGRGPRIALYSHDTQGLGHIRRNLLLSRVLSRDGGSPTILLLSGLREASAFEMPSGVDCLTLPSLGKGADGSYFPRSLGVTTDDLVNVRTRTITAVLQSFAPDVLIVDKAPRGVHDELLPGLRWLRASTRTRIILGLREILDDPEAVRREWSLGEYDATIRTFYDRIWVYGDPVVYDLAREYGLAPDIADLVRHTGYLNPLDADPTLASPARSAAASSGSPRTLCVVGGGRDGVPLAEAFLQARLPGPGELITGPRMSGDARRAMRALADARPDIELHEFVTDPCPLLARADRVVSMGGYNTMCEIMAYGRPALVVPRIEPRTEQLIRATRLAGLGLVDVLHPDRLDSASLSDWLARDAVPVTRAGDVIDFSGVTRLPVLLEEVLRDVRVDKEPTHAVR
jgi:predicted glycosyltransferase